MKRPRLNNFLLLALVGIFGAACSRQADTPGTGKEPHESMCWRRLATNDAPSARLDHAMAADSAGKRIYLWGGRNGSRFFKDLWVFDPTGPDWRRIETDQAPSARSGHSLVFHPGSGRLLLFGGFSFDSSAEVKFHSDLWIFSEEEGWSREFVGAGPSGRAWHAALVNQDAMIIFGGFAGLPRYYLQDIWSLDIQELSFRRIATDGGPLMTGSPMLLSLGDSTSLLAFGPSALLVFGRFGIPEPSRTGLWSLKVELDSWSAVDATNSPDDDFTLVARDASRSTLLVGRGPEEEDENREWSFWEMTAGDEEWREFEADAGPATSHRMVCASDPTRSGAWTCFGGALRDQVGGDTWSLAPCGDSGAQ